VCAGTKWGTRTVHRRTLPGQLQRPVLTFAHSTASGRQSAFPWIVPGEAAAACGLASNITWTATTVRRPQNYTRRRSAPRSQLAEGTEAVTATPGSSPGAQAILPAAVVDRDRAVQLHRLRRVHHRPIEGRQACTSPGEWRLLGWLERRGCPRLRLLARRTRRRYARPEWYRFWSSP